MPIHEYECNVCHRKEERWYATHGEVEAREKEPQPCKPNPKKCKGFLSRRVSAPNFSVRGFNAQNGYSGGGQ